MIDMNCAVHGHHTLSVFANTRKRHVVLGWRLAGKKVAVRRVEPEGLLVIVVAAVASFP
jgi:hypothetical protein